MYLKDVFKIHISSGHRLSCIDQNVRCDTLHPEVAEAPGSEILEVSPWCPGSTGKVRWAPLENGFALWSFICKPGVAEGVG